MQVAVHAGFIAVDCIRMHVKVTGGFECRCGCRSFVHQSAFRAYRGLFMQAPVPYLNRALAEEQLGVDADQQDQHQSAQQQYQGAVQVTCVPHSLLPPLPPPLLLLLLASHVHQTASSTR